MGHTNMGCGGSDGGKKAEEPVKVEKSIPKAEKAAAPASAAGAPGADDMAKAKLLYVKLKCKWDHGVEGLPTNMEQMRGFLGDGGGTEPWKALEGLRHKYFLYNEAEDTVFGVYVFFSQEALDKYMASELFKQHKTFPHFSSVDAEVKDVMCGSELSVEQVPWPNGGTRSDLTDSKMLIVTLKMAYDAEGSQCPNYDAFKWVMHAPGGKEMPDKGPGATEQGMGFPGMFTGAANPCLKGLRSKYFAYDEGKNECYGFYTFLSQAALDEYMASDLFKSNVPPPAGTAPPHVASAVPLVCEVLPGTEKTMDMGAWGKAAGSDRSCC